MIEQHSFAQTTWAHLLPGVVGFAFYVPAARLAIRVGLDSSFALFLTMLVVLVPCELALLRRARNRTASTPGAGPLFPWTLHQPVWVYVAAVPVLLAWAFFCFFVLAGREERLLSEYLFAWPPAGLFGSAVRVTPSKGALIMTWAFGLLVNGVLVPVVEELYFRGYLLPRIPLGRRWAPLLNAALFSVYHVFSPWQNLSRMLAVAPIAYVVSWRRSIAVGIATHCLLNTIAMLLVLPSLLR